MQRMIQRDVMIKKDQKEIDGAIELLMKQGMTRKEAKKRIKRVMNARVKEKKILNH